MWIGFLSHSHSVDQLSFPHTLSLSQTQDCHRMDELPLSHTNTKCLSSKHRMNFLSHTHTVSLPNTGEAPYGCVDQLGAGQHFEDVSRHERLGPYCLAHLQVHTHTTHTHTHTHT